MKFFGSFNRLWHPYPTIIKNCLIDAYGNTVETLFENGIPRDANYFASMNATGSASVNSQGAVAALERQLAELRAERAMMENKTKRLDEDYLDLDLLDERARSVLGYIRADEILIR